MAKRLDEKRAGSPIEGRKPGGAEGSITVHLRAPFSDLAPVNPVTVPYSRARSLDELTRTLSASFPLLAAFIDDESHSKWMVFFVNGSRLVPPVELAPGDEVHLMAPAIAG